MKQLKYLGQSLASRLGVALDVELPADQQHELVRGLLPLVKTEHELIRLGKSGNGGYLVPDDLDGIVACFSPGVGATSSFEEDMVERGIRTFQADASMADTPFKHDLNDFISKYVGIVSDGQNISMADWVDAKIGNEKGDLLLQMDIEGSEWSVLADMPQELLERFRIIAIELHHMQMLVGRFGSTIIKPVIDKLLRSFDVVHVHPNNNSRLAKLTHVTFPQLVEVTFLRKDRSKVRNAAVTLPHPLDQDNMPAKPPVFIPNTFYAANSVNSAER